MLGTKYAIKAQLMINGVLCPTTFALETANTAVSHDYVYNGTTNNLISDSV